MQSCYSNWMGYVAVTLKWPSSILKLKHVADFICSALYLHFCRQMGLGLMLSETSNSFQHSNQPAPKLGKQRLWNICAAQ